jgi:hypothetical protein
VSSTVRLTVATSTKRGEGAFIYGFTVSLSLDYRSTLRYRAAVRFDHTLLPYGLRGSSTYVVPE